MDRVFLAECIKQATEEFTTLEDNNAIALLTFNNDNLLELKLLQSGGYIASEAAKKYIAERGGAATKEALKAHMEKALSNETNPYVNHPKRELAMKNPTLYLNQRLTAQNNARRDAVNNKAKNVAKGMSEEEAAKLALAELKLRSAQIEEEFPEINSLIKE